MKIIQINAVNALSSTGRITLELNDFFMENGCNSVIAYSKGPSVIASNEYKIGCNFDTKIHGLLSRITGKQGYFSYFATKKLLRFMDEYFPDVVILHNLHGNYINLPILLKYLAKRDIATVAVLHDCWFYTGKCCHYTTQKCYKWKESCGNCPQLKKYNKSWFFDRTKQMHRDKIKLFSAIPRLAVVGVSDWIINEAKKSSVFKTAKIFKRIYNWIDTETFTPQHTDDLKNELGLEGKKVLLAVASGWNREKGIDTLIEISSKLFDDERLVIVGSIGDTQLNDNTVHIPPTNSLNELAKLYSMADVFIQPSLEETFGKVTAEALSCGTPVVCFNSTANPELIGEDCGAVAEVGNLEDLLLRMRKILSDGKYKYSQNCRNFAIKSFEKQNNLKKYVDIFQELLN